MCGKSLLIYSCRVRSGVFFSHSSVE